MRPEVRAGSAFELLRLSAARVNADVAIVEVEGRFAGGGRFARRPRLVLEGDAGRVEHAPVHAETVARRWRGTYAVPADLLDEGTLALGVRGALLGLPAPDVDDGDRLAALAREVNALRRALESAEVDAASAEADLRERVDAAEQEAVAARREREAAVARAREEAATEAEARIGEVAADADARVHAAEAQAATRVEMAEADAAARVAEAERRLAEAHDRAAQAEAGAEEATRRADALEVDAMTARDAHAEERRRAEMAIAELQASLEDARSEAASALERRGEPDAPSARDLPTDPIWAIDGEGDGAAERDRDEAEDDDDADVGADGSTTALPVVGRAPLPRRAADESLEGWVPMHHRPSPARWVAVGALFAFFIVLLILLGFFS